MRKLLVFPLILVLGAGIFSGCTPEEAWADGSYEASAEGFNDDVLVEVVIAGGIITEINILEHDETEEYAEEAFDEVIPAIIEAQSPDVDSVSGATYTADAVIEAVEKALEQAEN